MPVPKPEEDKKGFISRCIPYVKKEHPDWKPDKCVAVCYSIWKQHHPNSKSYDINKASDIQSLRFNKEKFNREQAVSWAKSHNFKYNDVEETTNQFRLRQFLPEKCIRSGGMIHLEDGVSGYVCPTSEKINKVIEEIKGRLPHISGHHTPYVPSETQI